MQIQINNAQFISRLLLTFLNNEEKYVEKLEFLEVSIKTIHIITQLLIDTLDVLSPQHRNGSINVITYPFQTQMWELKDKHVPDGDLLNIFGFVSEIIHLHKDFMPRKMKDDPSIEGMMRFFCNYVRVRISNKTSPVTEVKSFLNAFQYKLHHSRTISSFYIILILINVMCHVFLVRNRNAFTTL